MFYNKRLGNHILVLVQIAIHTLNTRKQRPHDEGKTWGENEHFHASASCTTKVLAEMKACREFGLVYMF